LSGIPNGTRLRFGLFEADFTAGELRKRGRKIPLQDQPFRVLTLLLQRPGELITREEFQKALWTGDTFVEFDEGLNKAIQKLRQALDDSSDNPRFIETLPRKGYRFIAPVERANGEPAVPANAQTDLNPLSPPAIAPVRHAMTERLAWALLTAVTVALAVVSAIHFRQPVAELSITRFLVPPPEGVILSQGTVPVVSPDGRHFVFMMWSGAQGKAQLWVRDLDSPAMRLVAVANDISRPFWSPDSRYIAFVSEGKLEKVDASGGPPQVIEDGVEPENSGAWNHDGSILIVARGGGMKRFSADGGEAQLVRDLDKSQQEIGQSWPEFLPDGRHFLFSSHRSAPGKAGIYVGSLDSKETRLLLPTESKVSYIAPGYLVYSQQNTLVAQTFDGKKLGLSGPVIPIAQPVMPSQFSVSQNGVLVYHGAASTDVQLAWYDRQGKRLGTIGEPGQYQTIVLSPDENRVVLERSDLPSQTINLWILDLASGILSRQTSHAGNDADPRWSPDGRELVFGWHRKGFSDLYRKAVGGNDDVLLFESGEPKYPKFWLKDSKSMLFINSNGRTLYQLSLTGDRQPVVLTKSEFNRDNFVLSPDERWVAFNSNESGRWEVYVAAFPAFTEKRQVSATGGCQALWRKDGKELFYLTMDGKLMAAEVKTGASLQSRIPQMLFQSRTTVSPIYIQYCVSADGKRFLIKDPAGEDGAPFTVVLNWTAALKR
jgi:Tol biopolymer transport system component/DNA-binding winged helix-turn-helix (wHTH) protein